MLDTVIFDMDGLLIDSEPHWQRAGMETLASYNASITLKQYHSSTGLRTREWLEYWFDHFSIHNNHTSDAIQLTEDTAIKYIQQDAIVFPGTQYVVDFFREKNFKIGLATSSPLRLVNVVLKKLGLENIFDAISSAEGLPLGKPHPQVYLNCALELGVSPLHCLCFEDSFNGLIAAKAARMHCIAVPAPEQFNDARWGAADLTIRSLMEVNSSLMTLLEG
ncbi:MAG: hexitol phosphatase HxpB [Chitinophagaceae bacterium]